MQHERQVHPYDDYRQYIHMQRAKSLRTRRQTRRYAWHRAELSQRLKSCCPSAHTMLCLGARNDLEVRDFCNQGFDAQGIDLFQSQHIIKCDMSRIDRHPDFAGKTFDIFLAIHAIEHCLDFDGFLRCLPMCGQALACVTPQVTRPTSWDCTAFAFARPDAGNDDIELAFPGFKVAWKAVINRTLMFVATRHSCISATATEHGAS